MTAKQEDIYHRRPVVKRNISWIFSVYINFSRRPLYCWRNWFMSWEIIWHRKLISFIWWSLEIMKLWYTNWNFCYHFCPPITMGTGAGTVCQPSFSLVSGQPTPRICRGQMLTKTWRLRVTVRITFQVLFS